MAPSAKPKLKSWQNASVADVADRAAADDQAKADGQVEMADDRSDQALRVATDRHDRVQRVATDLVARVVTMPESANSV